MRVSGRLFLGCIESGFSYANAHVAACFETKKVYYSIHSFIALTAERQQMWSKHVTIFVVSQMLPFLIDVDGNFTEMHERLRISKCLTYVLKCQRAISQNSQNVPFLGHSAFPGEGNTS